MELLAVTAVTLIGLPMLMTWGLIEVMKDVPLPKKKRRKRRR